MPKKNLAIITALAAGLLLTGCSISTTENKPSGSPSASPTQTQSPEDVAALVYPGGMPKVVDPGTVTDIEIQEGLDQAKAKEAYAWVASFVQISFNDSTLQQMDTFREYGLFSFSQYFSANGLKVMEAHFQQYADQGNYGDLDVAMRYVGNRGLMTVLPTEGYKYLNSPVFDQFQYGKATVEYGGETEGLTTYKVAVPVTTRLLLVSEADNKKYETTFNRTFEIWVIETGDATKPFLIDVWNENPLSWTAKEVK